MKERKQLVVSAIKDGTVIDHIPAKSLFKVIHILGLDHITNQITFGTNLDSGKLGKKGIIKLSEVFFEKEDLNRIIARRSRVEQDLKRCLGEIQQEKAALAKLATRLAEAEGDCKRMTDSLNGIQRRMRGREKELGFAEKALASLQRDAAAVWKSFQKLSSRVNDVKRVESYQRARTEFHFRNAGAVTSLVFVLIGIPLGILSRRGSVLMAFVISFFAVLILYYPLMMVGKMLSLDAYMTPWLAQWLPDVVVAGVGTSLLAWGIRR